MLWGNRERAETRPLMGKGRPSSSAKPRPRRIRSSGESAGGTSSTDGGVDCPDPSTRPFQIVDPGLSTAGYLGKGSSAGDKRIAIVQNVEYNHITYPPPEQPLCPVGGADNAGGES